MTVWIYKLYDVLGNKIIQSIELKDTNYNMNKIQHIILSYIIKRQ